MHQNSLADSTDRVTPEVNLQAQLNVSFRSIAFPSQQSSRSVFPPDVVRLLVDTPRAMLHQLCLAVVVSVRLHPGGTGNDA
jgi:hypothetical protein